MAFWLLAGSAAVLFALFEYQQRRQRRELLATFRAEWGHPLEHTRDFPMIAGYHQALATEGEGPIDERTAKDLNLDALFAALDRTVCPVGQQLLYHRLRTTPTSDDLAAFEALMTRLAEDSQERERIQLALARLRGHSGQAWWLTQPDVLDIRTGDVIFPLLAPIVPVALLLSAVWTPALAAAVAGILVNFTVRYVTAKRLVPLLYPFRQLGPLITTATTVRAVTQTSSPSTGERLTSDLSKLRRLGRMANVVSRDPSTSDEYSGAVFEVVNTMLLLDANVLLRTTRKAIYMMVERRQMPGVTRIGRRVLFRHDALLDWLDRCRTPSPKE